MAGVTSQVEFIDDDYRNVTGHFDVFCLGWHAGTCRARKLPASWAA